MSFTWKEMLTTTSIIIIIGTLVKYSDVLIWFIYFIIAVGILIALGGCLWLLAFLHNHIALMKINRTNLINNIKDEAIIETLADGSAYVVTANPNVHVISPHQSPMIVDSFHNATTEPDDHDKASWLAWLATKTKFAASDIPILEEQPQIISNLVEALQQSQNILVVGSKGSGKTDLLHHLALQRMKQEHKLVIFDSHDFPSKWVPNAHRVGNGRDYQNIWEMMMQMLFVMDKRYKKHSNGVIEEGMFPPITSFIDEFTLLPTVFKRQQLDVQEFSVPILTEGRKVSIGTIWGIHSDRAKYLGLQGGMDLLENFDAIVRLKKVQKEYRATVDFGDGEIEAITAGPYTGPRGSVNSKPPSSQRTSSEGHSETQVVTKYPLLPQLSDLQLKILIEYDNGNKIIGHICDAIGYARAGKNYATIRGILKAYGRMN